jgi:mxaJ protein
MRHVTAAAACLGLVLVTGLAAVQAKSARVLRVCSDPNNLPFSNEKLEGFENRLADLLADEMHARVEYTWFAQRRGFVRNTIRERKCDIIMGIPSSFELVMPTKPYYRSTYVFVTRTADSIRLASFDDPKLRDLTIGVHLIGDDYSNTPPAHSLSRRGIIENVRGFTIYGDYSLPNPPARILDALMRKEIDVAVVWGPLAGYFAKHDKLDVDIEPVTPQIDVPFMPMVFDIAMGVRREDVGLKEEVESILARRRADVEGILDEYGIPRVGVGR